MKAFEHWHHLANPDRFLHSRGFFPHCAVCGPKVQLLRKPGCWGGLGEVKLEVRISSGCKLG